MTDMTTNYLGLQLKSPIVVSSNPLNKDLNMLAQMEAAGAGAIVLPSLFEEQIKMQDMGLIYARYIKKEQWPVHLRRIPDLDEYNKGVGGYLALISEASRALDIPVIASLNATSHRQWSRYATLVEAVGAAAIELNVYYIPTSVYTSPEEVTNKYISLVKSVKANCKLPVAVKLHPYFHSIPYMARQLSDAGADAVVLFNRFYQPDIDLDTETVSPNLQLSDSAELRERLRWAALLYRQVPVDIAVTGGVHTGQDALKAILSGANVAMVASALLKHGPAHIASMLDEMKAWMVRSNYEKLTPLIGKLSPKRSETLDAFERADYIQELNSYRTDMKEH